MFVDAIDEVKKFTRPIHVITRAYGSTRVIPGAATMFFINADGWAFTCAHVARHLIESNVAVQNHERFKAALAVLPMRNRQSVRTLERQFGYLDSTIVDIHNRFMNCVEGRLDVDIRIHPTLDVALLHFKGYDRLLCESFPIFLADADELKPGKFLCRFGFPFPEFTNYEHDAVTDAIRWTDQGRQDTPFFPIEGMLTRQIGRTQHDLEGLELSTPGLKGQSGGPLFDARGRIAGMQASTGHIDLDFDVDIEVVRNGKPKRLQESAVLHVGKCVHLLVLKQFMRDHAVRFAEG